MTRLSERDDELARALEALAYGRLVVLDDDLMDTGTLLVGSASAATPATTSFFVRHTSGYLCAAAPSARWDALRVPSAAPPGRIPAGVHFGVAIDAAEGVTTGISAHDRSRTLQLVADPWTAPKDLVRPGHLVSVRLHEMGLDERPSLEEAAGELVRLSGRGEVTALAHLVSTVRPTEIATSPDACRFASRHGLARIGLRAVIEHVNAKISGQLRTVHLHDGRRTRRTAVATR